MLRRIFAASRYLILIAVLGDFLAAVVVMIYGGLLVFNMLVDVLSHGSFTTDGAKHLSVECVEIIDLFLLGTVLYIFALGLYDLFIDDQLPLPRWLLIRTLEDLKEKLLGVIIVLLAVTFLGDTVLWNGGTSILALGVAIGLVLFALGFILHRVFVPHHQTTAETQNDPPIS
jgi:uncharacterized membrane protein YqhA